MCLLRGTDWIFIYRQFNTEQFYVLPTQCIYVFCVDLRTNSDYFPIQHELTGFCNLDGVCLLLALFNDTVKRLQSMVSVFLQRRNRTFKYYLNKNNLSKGHFRLFLAKLRLCASSHNSPPLHHNHERVPYLSRIHFNISPPSTLDLPDGLSYSHTVCFKSRTV